jgi:hypothetical protein
LVSHISGFGLEPSFPGARRGVQADNSFITEGLRRRVDNSRGAIMGMKKTRHWCGARPSLA